MGRAGRCSYVVGLAGPSDQLSLVIALRSAVFGCGDDDLWHWKQAGGNFNLYAEARSDDPRLAPVSAALAYLAKPPGCATPGAGLESAVTAQALAEGVDSQVDLVRTLVRAALGSTLVRRAAVREHWRETYVGTVLDDGTLLEGCIDLVYREDDGSLVVVDYKTDAVPADALDSRITYYRPQMDAYIRCLTAATGEDVSAQLLFLHPETSVAAPIS